MIRRQLSDVEPLIAKDLHAVELQAGGIVVVGHEHFFGVVPVDEVIADTAADAAHPVPLVQRRTAIGDVLAEPFIPAEQRVRVTRPRDDGISTVPRPAYAVGRKGDRNAVPFVGGPIGIARLVEQRLVSSLRIGLRVVADYVATSCVEQHDVGVSVPIVLDQPQVGPIPEDSVLGGCVASAVEQVVRIEPQVGPFTLVPLTQASDAHIPQSRVPHAQRSALGVGQYRAIELETALPGVKREHERVAGITAGLVERTLDAAHLRDDQIVDEKLFAAAGIDRVCH